MLAHARPTPSLADLPELQAAALLLAARPAVTYRDVADRLGVEPRLVLRWLSEGLRTLRRLSAEEVAAEPLPKLDRERERLDVDALVLPVEA